MAVVQSLGHVQHVSRALVLLEATLAERLVQLSARGEFEDEVDAPVIVEVPEQSQYVPVPSESTNNYENEMSEKINARKKGERTGRRRAESYGSKVRTPVD